MTVSVVHTLSLASFYFVLLVAFLAAIFYMVIPVLARHFSRTTLMNAATFLLLFGGCTLAAGAYDDTGLILGMVIMLSSLIPAVSIEFKEPANNKPDMPEPEPNPSGKYVDQISEALKK